MWQHRIFRQFSRISYAASMDWALGHLLLLCRCYQSLRRAPMAHHEGPTGRDEDRLRIAFKVDTTNWSHKLLLSLPAYRLGVLDDVKSAFQTDAERLPKSASGVGRKLGSNQGPKFLHITTVLTAGDSITSIASAACMSSASTLCV